MEPWKILTWISVPSTMVVSIGLSLTAVGSIWFCMWQGTLLVLIRTLRVDSDKKNVCICWSGTASWHLKNETDFQLCTTTDICCSGTHYLSSGSSVFARASEFLAWSIIGFQDSPTWLFCPCCCHYYCSGTILWLFKVCLLHTFFSQGHIIYFLYSDGFLSLSLCRYLFCFCKHCCSLCLFFLWVC